MTTKLPKCSTKVLRRLLLVVLLVAVMVAIFELLFPMNAARATATVMINGVPKQNAFVALSEHFVGPRSLAEMVEGRTNSDGWCELKGWRRTYDPLSAMRGVIASPLSRAAWKRLFEKPLKETSYVPVGEYQVAVRPTSGKLEGQRRFTVEISSDSSLNNFVFDLSSAEQQ